jgi:very-short-patch-repair endonuclease
VVTSAQVEIGRLLDQEGVVGRSRHPELIGALDWLVQTGRIIVVLPGIYARPTTDTDPRVKIRAAALLDPDAVLTHRAAAFWSFWPELRVTTVEAALPRKRAPASGFSFRRRRIPPELVRHREGISLTDPALTALDLVPELGGDAIDQALRVRATTLADLHRALDLTPKRRGNHERLQMLHDSRDRPWAKSERLLHQLLRGAGLTGWQTNAPILLPEGRVFVDAVFAAHRVVIEVDGWEFHGRRPKDFDDTMRRHTALEAAGWRVLHVTWTHLVEEPDWVLAKILETLQPGMLPLDQHGRRKRRSA